MSLIDYTNIYIYIYIYISLFWRFLLFGVAYVMRECLNLWSILSTLTIPYKTNYQGVIDLMVPDNLNSLSFFFFFFFLWTAEKAILLNY